MYLALNEGGTSPFVSAVTKKFFQARGREGGDEEGVPSWGKTSDNRAQERGVSAKKQDNRLKCA